MTQGFATNNLQLNFPVGSIIMHGGASAPAGWVLCNGAAISRTTYASLYAVLSTTFGVGDGSTTFNVPDMRGAAPAGVGTSTGYTSNEVVALGTKYDDSAQGHYHAFWRVPGGGSGLRVTEASDAYNSSSNTWAYPNGYVNAPIADGTNGTPRTGLVTKGKTLGLNFIIKY